MVWKPTPPVTDRDTAQFLWHSRSFRFLFALAVTAMVVLSVTTYMLFDNTPPYVFIPEESRIVPSQASGGDFVTVKWKVHVNRACKGNLRRILFDPKTKVFLATYDNEAVAVAVGQLQNGYLNKTFLLPRVIQKGPIGYRAELHYRCNVLQNFFPLNITTPDLFFEIK
jgi:hypothetical protein